MHLRRMRAIWLLLILMIPFTFYTISSNRILNYPPYLYPGISLLLFAVLFVNRFKYISNNIDKLQGIAKIINWVYWLAPLALGAGLATSAVLLPFNYYNIYTADKEIITERCTLKSVHPKRHSKRAMQPGVFIELYGRSDKINGYREVMEEIYKNKNSKDYYVNVEIRKGLLGSYILEHWDIVAK